MGYEQIVVPLASTTGTFGGTWANKISQLLSGVDVSTTDATNQPSIATPTKFLYQALRIRDSPNAKSVIFQGPGSLDVDKTILIPTMPVGLNTDTLALLNSTQAFTQKTMDLSLNLLTETGKALGAILKHDGVEYTGLPRGTANQVLVTNAGATDIAWATLSSTNLPNVAFTNAANTFTSMQSFTASPTAIFLNNAVGISGKDSVGTARTMLSISAANALLIGASAGLTDVYIYAGTGTQALRIDNTNTVLTSPTWGTTFVQNNNLGILMKDSGGTNRQAFRLNASNTIVIGDTGGIASIMMFSGHATTACLQIDAANTVLTSPTWGATFILANNISITGTRTDAATRPMVRMNTSNLIQFGDTSGNGTACSIYGGTSTSAIDINSVNQVTFNKIAQAATFEILSTWKVSDDATSKLEIQNTTNTDGQFAPLLLANLSSTVATTARALYVRGNIDSTNDAGSVSMIAIEARTNLGLVANRPIFEVINYNTTIFRINAKGDILNTTIGGVGNFESCERWLISDDTASYIELVNGTSADARFYPLLQAVSSANSVAGDPVLYFRNFTTVANDTGTMPIVLMDMRRVGSATVTTRPLFDFRNNGVSVFQLGVANITLKDAYDLVLGTGTGTKIGTGPTQKLAFYGDIPIIQPAAITSPPADVNSLKTAVDAIRTVLANLGLTA